MVNSIVSAFEFVLMMVFVGMVIFIIVEVVEVKVSVMVVGVVGLSVMSRRLSLDCSSFFGYWSI